LSASRSERRATALELASMAVRSLASARFEADAFASRYASPFVKPYVSLSHAM
jgi:hypothetical protein